MENLTSLEPCELVILATVLAFLLSDNLDAGELNVLGNFIVAVGGLLLSWAAQLDQQEKSSEKANGCDLDELKNQIRCLQEKCDRLELCSQHSRQKGPHRMV
ncbi:hypothetical protein FL966_04415 [Caproiciproducens galactitolivorans]|uniref:Uncharacterized protein n=1 Tax=Caproiciproducens galactitolivorans TaxID=642589 RepID=A0A4Z0YMI2_9FIRM|nr:hypothetical protein [Caproiciproducens galactitolivorans]QEY34360.1 hypothetical protein FL966_04415 [Caproiciproducens galactitolivorans]TGJ77872.1 hypothetical protein CAGA_02810 [Caproiciproducens galactitolivorans]